MNTNRTLIALNAVTATTVSNKFFVGGAKRIAVLLRRANNAGGTSAFTIKASLDPEGTVTPVMTALNLWIDNVTNANTLNLTRVNGTSIANADGDKFLFLDANCIVNWLEITVTETADGTHSAFILLEQ
jgi:hypothetical protein